MAIRGRILMTPPGFAELMKEIAQLRETSKLIVEAIAEARSHGDLSENAEYHSAKELQSMNKAKLEYLESMASNAEILKSEDIIEGLVSFGSMVVVYDLNREKEQSYIILSDYESDIKAGRISVNSPLGQALVGKKIGDIVEIVTPGGSREVKVKDIKAMPSLFASAEGGSS